MRPDRDISMIKRILLAASFLLGLTLPAFAVNWYVCSTCYTAVPQWAATTAYNSSTPSLVRQLAAPAVNSERVFRETVSTCTSGSTEPTWILLATAASRRATEPVPGPKRQECRLISISARPRHGRPRRRATMISRRSVQARSHRATLCFALTPTLRPNQQRLP